MTDHTKVSVAIVGASGYTGIELTRILMAHPAVSVEMLCASRNADQPASMVDPSLMGLPVPDLVSFDAEAIAARCTYAFLGLPHKTAQTVTDELLARGVKGTYKALTGAPFRAIRCQKANGKNDLHSGPFSAHGSGAS